MRRGNHAGRARRSERADKVRLLTAAHARRGGGSQGGVGEGGLDEGGRHGRKGGADCDRRGNRSGDGALMKPGEDRLGYTKEGVIDKSHRRLLRILEWM